MSSYEGNVQIMPKIDYGDLHIDLFNTALLKQKKRPAEVVFK